MTGTSGAAWDPGPAGAARPDPAGPVDPADSLDPAALQSVIKTYVIASLAIGLIPAPVFDMLALAALQVDMTRTIARQFGMSYTVWASRALMLNLVTGVLPVVAGIGLLKVFPGLGTLAGGAGVSLASGACTYAVGVLAAQHFASGGGIDFNPAAWRARLRAEFERGLVVARTLQRRSQGAGGETPVGAGADI